jgi:hypothetical protein
VWLGRFRISPLGSSSEPERRQSEDATPSSRLPRFGGSSSSADRAATASYVHVSHSAQLALLKLAFVVAALLDLQRPALRLPSREQSLRTRSR